MTTAFGPIRWAKSVPAIRRADGRVDSTAHHVLLALATYAHRDGTGARPSIEALASDCYLTPRFVRQALQRIADAGLISETARLTGDIQVWRLHLDVTDAGPSVVDSHQERRRAAGAERQRRYRERIAKSPNGDASARRHVTPSHDVTTEAMSRRAEASRNAVDSVTSRRATTSVTHPRPSQPQVSPATTAIELPYELPKELSPPPVEKETTEAFDAFWTAYPRKIGKGQARAAWAKAVERADPAAIVAAANEFGIERGNQDPKFTPYPATWLNGERWTDEPAKHHLRVVGQHQPWEGYADQSVYDQDI